MAEEAQIRIEVERIVNLIRSQGWEKVEERIEGNKLTLVIEKKVVPLGGEE